MFNQHQIVYSVESPGKVAVLLCSQPVVESSFSRLTDGSAAAPARDCGSSELVRTGNACMFSIDVATVSLISGQTIAIDGLSFGDAGTIFLSGLCVRCSRVEAPLAFLLER